MGKKKKLAKVVFMGILLQLVVFLLIPIDVNAEWEEEISTIVKLKSEENWSYRLSPGEFRIKLASSDAVDIAIPGSGTISSNALKKSIYVNSYTYIEIYNPNQDEVRVTLKIERWAD
jgi:hypothetical protein